MLPFIFFGISLFYSIVGLGGGSSYLAVLSVSGISFLLLPKIALICNLLVVSGGSYHYYKNGLLNKDIILPFVLTSIPFAFLGGLYPIREGTFLILLSLSLLFAGLRLLVTPMRKIFPPKKWISLLAGAGIGLLSGIVGIGGGIFLSPLLVNLNWGRPKEVAGAASVFILLNSLAGLAGQLIKGFSTELFNYWPLFLAVIIGGQIGSRIGTHSKVNDVLIKKVSGVLILTIGLRLIWQIFVSNF